MRSAFSPIPSPFLQEAFDGRLCRRLSRNLSREFVSFWSGNYYKLPNIKSCVIAELFFVKPFCDSEIRHWFM